MRIPLTIFFTYNGDEYSGMQYQTDPHVKTIQNELVDILFSQGFIKSNKFTQLVKFHRWSRAARTDKGVHAIINGISCAFNIEDQFLVKGEQKQEVNKQKFVKLLNKLFPSFTIYNVFEVDKKFQLRKNVLSRVYSYVCPLKIFEKQGVDRQQTLAKINRLCQYFIGTRNYHNYSSGVKPKDPTAKRYMISMNCKVHEKNSDWIRFQLHGQSFIYHQIRKMIGGIAQMFHQNQPQNFLQNTFFNNIIYMYLAPAQGLFLKSLNFESYNKNSNAPQKILFEDVQQIMDKKQQQLQTKIIESQEQTHVFQDWFKNMGKQSHNEKVFKNMDIQQ